MMNKLTCPSRIRIMLKRVSKFTATRLQTRMLSSLSSFGAPRTTSSFSEPSHFVYRGWHQQPSTTNSHHYHSYSSAHYLDNGNDEFTVGTQLRASRIMSPKTESPHYYEEAAWDEDYDEDNLHITPHEATNRCEEIQQSFESLDHNDLYELQGKDAILDVYSWNTEMGISPDANVADLLWNDAAIQSDAVYDDGVSNINPDGEIAFDR